MKQSDSAQTQDFPELQAGDNYVNYMLTAQMSQFNETDWNKTHKVVVLFLGKVLHTLVLRSALLVIKTLKSL